MVDQNKNYDQQGTAAKQALEQSPFQPITEPIRTGNQEIDGTPRTTTSEQEIKKATQELDSIRRGERWIIVLNFGLFVVGAVVCVIYGLQLSVMRGQLAVMRNQLNEMKSGSTDTHELAVQAKNQADRTKAVADAAKKQSEQAEVQTKATSSLAIEAKRSADAAHDAVGIAKQSLDLSQRSIEIQERPWIGMRSVDIKTAPLENGEPMTGTLIFSNSGKSPAFDVELLSACSYDIQPALRQSPFILIPVASKSILMPGDSKSSADWTCKLSLSPQQYALVRQGIKNIYVFGEITYKDIIGPTIQNHVTRFCNVWLEKAKILMDCPEYNSAD